MPDAGSTGTAQRPSPAPSSPWSTAPSASPTTAGPPRPSWPASPAPPLLLAAFVAIERRTADPLVPLELFRSRTLSTGVALAVLGGAARASTFVLVALYLQQALGMAPRQAGLAMVPTSLTGFAVSLALLPRILRALGPQRTLVIGLVILAAGHLWLAHAPTQRRVPGRRPARAAARRRRRRPQLHAHHHGHRLRGTRRPTPASRSGLAGSATQVGAALGTATFTAIGISAAGGIGTDTLSPIRLHRRLHRRGRRRPRHRSPRRDDCAQ